MTLPKTLIQTESLPSYADYQKTNHLQNNPLNFLHSITKESLFVVQGNLSLLKKIKLQTPVYTMLNKKRNRTFTVNKDVINYYRNECAKNNNQAEKLVKKYKESCKKAQEAFYAFLQFEKDHPGVRLVEVENTLNNRKKEIRAENYEKKLILGHEFEEDCPEIPLIESRNAACNIPNTEMFDISMFNRGIRNDEEKRFTGECCQKGYITGLETLSPKEQREYIKLLKKAQKACQESRNYEEKLRSIEKQSEKNMALQDAAQSGMLNVVGSEEYEENVYNEWVNVRNECNPFYKEIKDLEQKRNKLWLKYDRTKEDEILIEQYYIQIMQLTEASQAWSISQSGKTINQNSDNNSINADSEHSADIVGESYQAGAGIKETTTGFVSYSDSNTSINAGITTMHRDTFVKNITQNANGMTPATNNISQTSENNTDLSLNVQYSRGTHFAVNSYTSYNYSEPNVLYSETNNQNNDKNYTQSLHIKAYNFNSNVTGNFTNSAENSSAYISGSTDYSVEPFKFEVNGTYQNMKMKQNSAQPANQDIKYYKYGFKTSANIGKHWTPAISFESTNISLLNNEQQETQDNNGKYSYEASLNGNYIESRKGLTLQFKPGLTFRHSSIGDTNSAILNITDGLSYNDKLYRVGLNLTGIYSLTFGKNTSSDNYSYSTTLSANAGYKNLTLTGNLTSISDNTSEKLRYGVSAKWETDIGSISAGYTKGSFEGSSCPELSANTKTDQMVYIKAILKLSNYENARKQHINRACFK